MNKSIFSNIIDNNSCLLKVHFNTDFKIVGGEIKHFMFENNRACSTDSFKIFSLLFSAPDGIKNNLNLKDVSVLLIYCEVCSLNSD